MAGTPMAVRTGANENHLTLLLQSSEPRLRVRNQKALKRSQVFQQSLWRRARDFSMCAQGTQRLLLQSRKARVQLVAP